jgi:hypothetical protein
MFPEHLKPNEQPYTAPKDNKLQPKAKKMPVEIDYEELAEHEDRFAWNLPCKADLYNNSLVMLDQSKYIRPANQIRYKHLPENKVYEITLPTLPTPDSPGFSQNYPSRQNYPSHPSKFCQVLGKCSID